MFEFLYPVQLAIRGSLTGAVEGFAGVQKGRILSARAETVSPSSVGLDRYFPREQYELTPH